MWPPGGAEGYHSRTGAIRTLTPQQRLDVHDGRPVNRFDGSDPQPGAADRAYDYWMKAERVRPIRRARGEHAGQRRAPVRPRMHLEHVALRTVKPGDHDDFVAD